MKTKLTLLLLCLSLSLTAFGQRNKKLIDSLTRQLARANMILESEKKEARKFEYLLTAKELALRSLELKDTIKMLTAVQCHVFWTRHKGRYDDIDVYRALYEALKAFDDPLIKTLPVKIGRMDNANYGMTTRMAEKLCLRIKRNMLLREWEFYVGDLMYERTCTFAKEK